MYYIEVSHHELGWYICMYMYKNVMGWCSQYSSTLGRYALNAQRRSVSRVHDLGFRLFSKILEVDSPPQLGNVVLLNSIHPKNHKSQEEIWVKKLAFFVKPCHIIKKDTWKSEFLLDIPHLLYTLNIYMVGFWDSRMRCGDKHCQKFDTHIVAANR